MLAQKSYGRLSRFLAMVKERGVRVIVVAMPQPVVYSLDPEIKLVVETAGMSFLDCRNVDGISPASFADEMHLATSGAVVNSRFLGRALANPIGKPETQGSLASDARRVLP